MAREQNPMTHRFTKPSKPVSNAKVKRASSEGPKSAFLGRTIVVDQLLCGCLAAYSVRTALIGFTAARRDRKSRRRYDR